MKQWEELTDIEKRRLANFFKYLTQEDGEPSTPEEVDDFLRVAGYTPEEVGKRLAAIAERELRAMAEREGLTIPEEMK